jgi:hypothetical protein
VAKVYALCDDCWSKLGKRLFPNAIRLTASESSGITCALLHYPGADAKLKQETERMRAIEQALNQILRELGSDIEPSRWVKNAMKIAKAAHKKVSS